ncbi:CDP-glucose 4,6-dehydratase [bacterium CG_4_9_14_3_um_filter_65_15]|nr:MAG: CDP-glucose 4,6-dehydratase [bacterium CG_4_9_14_3_um_filter_65_15]
MSEFFAGAFRDRRVLVTGHTGFKGSWLCLWLQRLGAEVAGYALAPQTQPNHSELLGLEVRSVIADLGDRNAFADLVANFRPEIVLHLAAQAIVREGYREPVATFATNVMGTVNLLDVCGSAPSVRAIVNVTSDKCYENRERNRGYRETDAMGGHDPYSASKGCSELVTACWRRSFFAAASGAGQDHVLLASCRAGNVIGGGDWGRDRLLPDIMRAAGEGRPTPIRNPGATRPWQHVLEPLSGYLEIGRRLLSGEADCAEAWNFGPDDEHPLTVAEVAAASKRVWDRVEIVPDGDTLEHPHEAKLLQLDCAKARQRLGWRPVWDTTTAIERAVAWYRNFAEQGVVGSEADLDHYLEAATAAGLPWASR